MRFETEALKDRCFNGRAPHQSFLCAEMAKLKTPRHFRTVDGGLSACVSCARVVGVWRGVGVGPASVSAPPDPGFSRKWGKAVSLSHEKIDSAGG